MTIDEYIVEFKKLSPKIFTKLHHRVNIKGQIRGSFDHIHEAHSRGVKDLLRRQDTVDERDN